MRIKPILATLVVAVSMVGLSACSDDSSSKAFNDADVSFAQDMIPHHRQATEMAALAADRRSAGVNARVASSEWRADFVALRYSLFANWRVCLAFALGPL